ncbi:MAG: hypothetical protein PHO63_00510 [Bacilli bacterium]|nr:hypothetical protein [Bacilli bacterium]MDD4809205.1 hypothetical protein [Bacilli bacterium]
MRESIANTYIFNLIILFIGIIIVVLVGSLSYSKTFKIKNRIVSIIEDHRGFDRDAQMEVAGYLQKAGYVTRRNPNCPDRDGFSEGWRNTDFNVCIYRYDIARGYYYHVVVFISFEIPVIGNILEFPLSGETKMIFDL